MHNELKIVRKQRKTNSVKEILSWQNSRRVVLEYISFKLGYNFSSYCYNVFSPDFSFFRSLSLEDFFHYIVSFG